MESHILNMYHQSRFRSIGHKILRSTSESLSSEGSCQQNSPEYVQEQQANQYEEESNADEYWEPQENQGHVWNHVKTENSVTEQSSQDSSSEEEENGIHVQEVALHRKALDANHIEELDIENIENDSLVEGHDYDIIQVYAVHPDFDLEVSSEEEELNDYSIRESSEDSDSGEYLSTDENTNYVQENQVCNNSQTPDICHVGLGINLDIPVVSNVDEYFIKDNKEKVLLEIKEKPVVNDVDEYFIKQTKHEPIVSNIPAHIQNVPNIPNIDDFFVKNEVPQRTNMAFHIPKVTPTVTDIFEVPNSVTDEVHSNTSVEQESHTEVTMNESDLDVLPNIEEIKKYLLEDIPYMKLKNAQKSCSVPHSPMHSICIDLDTKTCLSFEDLNLDLSDLNFDNDKDKSANSSKSEDIPRTLTDEDVNSFLITNKTLPIGVIKTEDDLIPQDMDIDGSIETTDDHIDTISHITVDKNCATTDVPKSTVLEFCIEKSAIKKENDVKVELDDYVDVESCNETIIPVLEANNLNSLLEQFEATEKFNTKPKRPVIKANEQKGKPYNSLTNGMRLQDAGVQLNKNKMRQIMMPSSINTAIRRSPSPVHSDHDYCSSKKRHSLPNLKGGQSLLKPEVLSSNSRILNSRHRSCKNKKIVYHLSSDDESEKCNINTKIKKGASKISSEDNDMKSKKSVVKQPVKATVPSTCRKKTSPVHSAVNDVCFDKGNGSVMVKNACKASDNPSSQSSNGSIKLTIKNKSEVIINNCDDIKDYQKDKKIEKNKSSSVSDKSANYIKTNNYKRIDTLDRNQNKNKIVNTNEVHNTSIRVKKEPNLKSEHFYTALFSNKQDVQMPNAVVIKSEKRSHEEDSKSTSDAITKIEVEQPQKKKKLNLQEYKLRRGASSNNSSATVSPEAIFPDMPIPDNICKPSKCTVNLIPSNGGVNYLAKSELEAPKKLFDPIREASRKILMNTKKQKAEAMRKRDEDIVMSKIPKVENLELQPLISEAEMMKIVGMGSSAEILPVPIVTEKPPLLSDYDEIVVVSVGTNTDEEVFKKMEQATVHEKRKSQTPPADIKSTINFKIKKSDHVLKHNVFDTILKDRSLIEEKKHSDRKIDKERFRDITATLKSVEKQVETKILSNSLFASIQDVVMKKAPEVSVQGHTNGEHRPKHNSPHEKKASLKNSKTTIVRQYDAQVEHGEDKIILHLEKQRRKPDVLSVVIQTETVLKSADKILLTPEKVLTPKNEFSTNRKRNDSDMSMSSEYSPVRTKKDIKTAKVDEKTTMKTKPDKRDSGGTQTKEKRSHSRDRYDSKYRRSRSPSRGHRRKRSPSRNRSRSRSRYRRYRRSDSPYRRKRRSHTRSPYRKRRSPTPRREYRNRSRSRSKHIEPTIPKSPVVKKTRPSPQYIENNTVDKKSTISLTPPLIRKPTVSESSSDSTTSSSSSSSSSSSDGSVKSTLSSSTFRKEDDYVNKNYRSSYSSEDRESNTPVEERRIVFVGKLEKDINKLTLRGMFSKFGPVTEVRLHTKEDGSRYGFVTYRKSRDAWAAVEAASTFPQYDVGFGGRRAFCRQSYADLDGLEAKYTESAFHGQAALPARRNDDMSFEQMLLDVKKKLNQRKGDKKRQDDTVA